MINSKSFLILLSLSFAFQLSYAQSPVVHRSPKEIKATLGELITESYGGEIKEYPYRISVAKTSDGGTATLLKFDSPEPEAVRVAVKPSLKVYPNPVTDEVSITLSDSVAENLLIEVYNMVGVKILEVPIQSAAKYTISFTDYSPGVYFIRCHAGEEVLISKVVKQ